MSQRLLSMKQVMERIPLSKTEIYRRIREDRFPQPVHIGKHRIAFAETEINEWISGTLSRSQGAGRNWGGCDE